MHVPFSICKCQKSNFVPLNNRSFFFFFSVVRSCVGVHFFLGKYGIYGTFDADILVKKVKAKKKKKSACSPYNIFSTQLNVASRDNAYQKKKKKIRAKHKRLSENSLHVPKATNKIVEWTNERERKKNA